MQILFSLPSLSPLPPNGFLNVLYVCERLGQCSFVLSGSCFTRLFGKRIRQKVGRGGAKREENAEMKKEEEEEEKGKSLVDELTKQKIVQLEIHQSKKF